MDFTSINALLRWRVERSAQATAILKRHGGRWVEIPWQQVYDAVRFISQGLRALGLEKNGRAVILSGTRVEWIYADLAIMGCGGVVVPIFPMSPPQVIEPILDQVDARIIIAENPTMLDKLPVSVRAKAKPPKIILIEGPAPDNPDILTLSEVVELGRKQENGLYEKISSEVSENDLATIVFTSGSTGTQKGVIHAHRQLLAEQAAIQRAVQLREDETVMMLLPLSHVFGRVIEYLNIGTGFKLAIAESFERLTENLSEVRPHVLAAVPRVFEKIYSDTLRDVELRGKATKLALQWCLNIGEEMSHYLQSRSPAPLVLQGKYQAARRLFFDRFRQPFGSRMKFLVSSGAPLQKEIGRFFHASGLPVLEAYGMTELAGAVTMNVLNDFRIGSVGKPLSGVELALSEDGEIKVKSPMTMNGYWGDEQSTAEALQDGWLLTGDIGEIDAEGFWRITDRKKAIIITSGGRAVAPQNIESHMKSDPFIDQFYVHGDKRNFLTALVVLDHQNVQQWAKEKGIPSEPWNDLVKRPELVRLIEERIQLKNRDLAPQETIKNFAILPHSFTVEGGELTTTLKPRRKFIDQKYRETLDRFYN